MISYRVVLLWAIGLFFLGVAAALLEAILFRPVGLRKYDWREASTSLGVLVGRIASDLVPIAVAMPGAFWFYRHRLFEPEKLGVWAYVLLFFGLEFIYYWWHRVGHRSRWFWLSHAPHHTSSSMNIAASYRVGWTGRITATYILFAPMVLVGFDPRMVFAAYGLNLSYQAWIHVDWIPKIRFIEGVLNTPSAHRAHHGSNLEYLDVNYGGVLLIFDRMFGTYQAELDDVPVRYGLRRPMLSRNPLTVVFHQFAPLVRDLRSAQSPSEFIRYLFGPPGWRPSGAGDTTENLRRQHAEQQQGSSEPQFSAEAAHIAMPAKSVS